ncbi:MAG: Bax inhibitor-1 family protein [Myxococcales bacterium]|nr:Bax inhibitor-1 family protein [Myxococcales bacterium]
MNATDKLFGSIPLDERQAAVAKQTYALLSISLVSALVGGYMGSSSPTLMLFFYKSPILAFLISMVVINAVPRIALWAANRHPMLGLLALGADGFLSGLAISPLLFLARMVAPQLIIAAGAITAAAFLSVTGYILFTKERFNAPSGLLTGIFFSLIVAILLNSLLLHMTFLGIVISIGIAIFGVLTLIYATSEVLTDPSFDSPIRGALMLFAALFNIFVSALRLLLSLTSRD